MEQVLTPERLRQIAPSIFATEAHSRVSDRYSFLPTSVIVEGMRREGWQPVMATEQRVRTEDRRGFQKHMIRFRQSTDIERVASLITRQNHIVNKANPLAEFAEIVLTNAHDRSSTYNLHAGIFRLVCANGLVIADSTFQHISITHMNFNPDAVINASFKILEDVPKVMQEIYTMKEKQLPPPVAKAFAEAATIVKFGDIDSAPVRPEMLLKPRRIEDEKPDLWSTFNRVQENLMKGGLKDYSRHHENGKNFKRMRGVKGIDENIKLNKALWHLTQQLSAAL